MRETILSPMRDCISPRVGEFFQSLPEETRKDFESVASLSSLAAHTRLFTEHERPSSIYIPYDSQVKLFRACFKNRFGLKPSTYV